MLERPYPQLVVWDRLDVGPARVEPMRVIVPYRLRHGGQDETVELVYRWTERVFDPNDPADRQLANLLGAQVALNYGLFADQLVFHGPFAATSRQFLAEMAENTAQEILVHKLLRPTPFQRGAAVGLTVVRAESYLQARVSFADPEPVSEGGPFAADRERVAVLSSGGKDSLLTLGLLEEAGFEAHPLFVNESGRHWFTALNGWRVVSGTRPRTARVWTSSDRVFVWFDRRLPFVRPDFQRVKADQYPTRLYTVAVFAFGVLPLMRRRGVGRLVIGDEYDTTVPAEYQGIKHYSGLYDQSRYFDERLTRLFDDLGWGVQVFSVLRPCGELLIERILANRYPDLLAAQVSCHATTVSEERARPCGACEKCRRVVAMLTANGADPSLLGYGPDVVRSCLVDFARRGVHQDPDDAEHLAWRLVRSGKIPLDSPMGRAAREHPHVEALRVDPERSPPEVVPDDVYARVMAILVRHAPILRRGEDGWVTDTPPTPQIGDPLRPGQVSWRVGEFTWPQALRRHAETDVALLPVGSLEQHGPHLPMDLDTWDAAHLAEEVARACAEPRPLVLPALAYGVSYHHDHFAGTVSVDPETLARLVYEIGMSVARNGVRKFVIVNGHGGNVPALHLAAQRLDRDARVFVAVDSGETSDRDVAARFGSPQDLHAGEVETSTTLATRPHLVDLARRRAEAPPFAHRHLDLTSSEAVPWFHRNARVSGSGVLGDPTRASADKGRQIWDLRVRGLARLVGWLQRTPVERLHEAGA